MIFATLANATKHRYNFIIVIDYYSVRYKSSVIPISMVSISLIKMKESKKVILFFYYICKVTGCKLNYNFSILIYFEAILFNEVFGTIILAQCIANHKTSRRSSNDLTF